MHIFLPIFLSLFRLDTHPSQTVSDVGVLAEFSVISCFNRFERTFSVDVENPLCLVMFQIIQRYGHQVKLQHHLDDLFHCSAQIVCDVDPTSVQSFFL